MKNIHLIPTDKPSRIYLIKYNNRLRLTSTNPEYMENFGSGTQNQHIYITSDEEIKKDEYYLGEDNNIYCLVTTVNFNGKKIILTTDGDLIKEGVQAIDDEFLKWFVKNPSCEEAKVEITEISCIIPNFGDVDKYRIAIPKEEPKQLFTKGDKVLFTGKMLDEEVIDKVVTVFYTLGRGEVEDMSDIMDEYTHIYRVWNKDLKHIQKEEPKQETLEEAAVFKSHHSEEDFIRGGRWQQEQDKNRHSDEEVLELLVKMNEWPTTFNGEEEVKEWFEKFKKK